MDRRRQRIKRGDARRHRERVAGERARLVHRPQRCNLLHDLGAAPVRGHGQSTTDDFAERREVGYHTKGLDRTAVRDAEAGHDFVEDEQRAGFVGEVTQPIEEAGLGRDIAAVAAHRFDDDGRKLRRLAACDGARLLEVVEGRRERERGEHLRHARRVG